MSINVNTHNDRFEEAFNFFNASLFCGKLPFAVLTLQRKAKSRGYFAPYRFANRGDAAIAHEVALNPDSFCERTDAEILSTLVHEMVHLWQQELGKPSGSHHNKEWAAKMKSLGLHPSHNGLPGGKETGQRVTHYIVPGGAFEAAYAALEVTGFVLNWQSPALPADAKAKLSSKTKYTCEGCNQNAWAKPGAQLACYSCYEDDGEINRMVHNQ